MKIRGKAAFCLIGLMGISILAAACSGGGDSPAPGPGPSDGPDDPGIEIVVSAMEEAVAIKDYQVATYDYTSLFSISRDGQNVEVLDSYIDSSAVSETAGTYPVTCTYEEKTAEAEVTVEASVCEIQLSAQEVTVRQDEWDSFDYLSLFTATLDGEPLEITEDMIDSDVQEEAGDYTFTVSFYKTSATLTVHVTDVHTIECIFSYRTFEIEESAVQDYDYTSLFSLYIDGAAVRVTEDMIDTSALAEAEAGQEYPVVFRYSSELGTSEATAAVKVVADREIVLTGRSLVIYPNSDYIDLTQLFEIRHGDETVPVTSDMITGSINYSEAGENIITLTYGGKQCTATVEVRVGAVIEFASSDVISVARGTEQNTYDFAKDFVVTINGIRFTDIPTSYFTGLDEVNFGVAGDYDVTLTIPYCYTAYNQWTGVTTFEYVSETITYRVEENTCTVRFVEDRVTLPQGTDEYDVLSNLNVWVNGVRMALTENPDWADPITIYARIVSGVNFREKGEQEIVIQVYPGGPDGEPVEVRYPLIIESDIQISVNNAAVFSGETLYTRDLFTITSGGEDIPVTSEMVSGKVDTFTPGVYTVTIEYEGIVREAQVVVFDNAMKGTYRTTLTTIPVIETDSDDSEDLGWGSYSADTYAESVSVSETTRLGALVIGEDGTITHGGSNVEIISGIDAHTMLVRLNSYVYTLYYNDGIIVLDPDNSIKMLFSDAKRPMVYFNNAEWQIDTSVTINSSATHVLTLNYVSYSIDTFRITKRDTAETMWYALMVELAEKTSADTYYTVTWGEAEYADDFVQEAGADSSLTFRGNTYAFTMESASVGRIRQTFGELKYANMTFSGTVDGKDALLNVTSAEGFELIVDGVRVFSVSGMAVGSLANGGVDYDADVVFLYGVKDSDYGTYSYRFVLDTENRTFTIDERDRYYGVYETEDMYLFLDGYGHGLFNFNTTYNTTTRLNYTVRGQEVTVRFVDSAPSFTHGSYATFYIADLLNILTVKQFESGEFAGAVFENSEITDGAIVSISSYVVRKNSNTTNARNAFLDLITIVTPDGELTGTQKSNAVDTSTINFNQAGFYRFSVTVSVGGQDVKSYFAVQVLGDIYSGNALAANYTGVINGSYFISIDVYGMTVVTVQSNGDEADTVRYTGMASIGANGFVINAAAENGSITLTGVAVEDGIVLVRCRGAVSFYDYFTTGTSTAAGGDSGVLRVISVSGTNVFILSESGGTVGTVVEGRIVNGSLATNGTVIALTENGTTVYYRVDAWGDLETGLTVLENYTES